MSRLHLSRRQLIGSAAAAAGLAALPGSARAAVSAADRRFLFIYTCGGWDSTFALAPLLGLDTIHTESDAAEAIAGNIPYVSHPDRPSVDSFFTQHSAQLAIINGIYVPSISHGIALRLMTTGNISARGGDWPTRIAAHRADHFLIPHLLLGGLGWAGDNGMFVARSSDSSQLAELSTGEILARSDLSFPQPSEGSSALVDDWLAATTAGRADAAATDTQQRLAEGYATSLERAGELKSLSTELDLSGGGAFSEQLALGVKALSAGLSRCVSVNHPDRSSFTLWDTHADNDFQQSLLFEDLFSHLLDLQQTLAATPGVVAGTLAEEVVVVVLSEMGRTPTLNTSGGKDHWPYTSALALGPGIAGDQVIGGFDSDQIGYRVDAASGEIDEGGLLMGQETLGATLMQAAGISPEEAGYEGELIDALLS